MLKPYEVSKISLQHDNLEYYSILVTSKLNSLLSADSILV